MIDSKIRKTQMNNPLDNEDTWRKKLTPEQYHVCREKGTEPPFTGKYTDATTSGTYHCICCGQALFTSEQKFHSGCGWPSFWAPLTNSLDEQDDFSHGMHRIEVTCKHCGAHLGHVFPDGPQPTGLRYCINSVALDLKESS
jgi:peptide-methionine (R)-S-oxide reductase